MESPYDKNNGNGERGTEAQWEHPNGRNESHCSKAQHPTIVEKLATLKTRLAEIKNRPYPHCGKDKQKIKKQISHLQSQLDERGVEHSRIAKGFQHPVKSAK